MYFQKGEFIQLDNGKVLEVLFADEMKALCLKLKNCIEIGWIYTGESVAISNRNEDYTSLVGVSKISNINVSCQTTWKPLRPVLTFPMV